MKSSLIRLSFLVIIGIVSCNRIATVSSDTTIDKPAQDNVATPPINLINARWVLREMQGEAIKLPVDISVRFIDKESVEGFSGCNSFKGQYVSEEQNIKIGPFLSTKMACEHGAVESKFMEVLEKTVSFYTDSKYLYLKDNEKIIAKFEAVYL